MLPFFFLHSKPGKPHLLLTSALSSRFLFLKVFCFSRMVFPLAADLLSVVLSHQTLVFGSFACATNGVGVFQDALQCMRTRTQKNNGEGLSGKKKKTSGEVFTPNGNKHMKVIVPTCVKEMGSQSFTQERARMRKTRLAACIFYMQASKRQSQW